MDDLLPVISRLLHVGTAIVLVGGTVFMRFVLMPSAAELPDDQHIALRDRLRNRWKRFVHAGIGLLLLSGFYNYALAGQRAGLSKLYHPLVGTKMLIAFIVFFIASAMVGRSARFEGMRNNPKLWLNVMVVLTGLIVAISGYAKVALTPVAVP